MKNPSLVEAIFLRSKIQPTFTCLWKTIPVSVKTVVLNQITFNTDEKPILNFYLNPNKWWLLTTKRIILKDKSIENIYLNEIRDIRLNKLFDEATNKLDINTIQFEINDKNFDLEVEKRTWHVIFKMLKFMINR